MATLQNPAVSAEKMFMIKKLLLIILSVIVLAAVVFTVHLPSRHLVLQFQNGILLYQSLTEKFKTNSLCQSDVATAACMTKIIEESGGFKFAADPGIAMVVLANANLPQDSFIQGNSSVVNSIKPENFWSKGIKGKSAKRIYKKEIQDLIKTLKEQKATAAKALEEKRFPAAENDLRTMLHVIDVKIAELSK